MADVKITLTGTELAELRMLLQRQAGKIDDAQTKLVLKMCGYMGQPNLALEEQLKYIAEKLLPKLG